MSMAATQSAGSNPHPQTCEIAAWSPTVASNVIELPELPQVGEEFCGFQLIAELGRGSFGRVYLAQQEALGNRLVALKVSSDISSETAALSQLQHANIVPVYSTHDGGTFRAVCMPYVGSATLQGVLVDIRANERVPTSGSDLVASWRKIQSTRAMAADSTLRMPKKPARRPSPGMPALPKPRRTPTTLEMLEGVNYVESVAWMMSALASGLAHAHERGILHRDLKPANVLITDEGQPMLVDFNLSEDVKLRSAQSAVLAGGTLPYMSPEQIREYHGLDAEIDERSDLFSLGVIFFELLTGKNPFGGDLASVGSAKAHLESRAAAAPPRPSTLNPAVPKRIDAIVQRCLQADPDHRYQTAQELTEDLYACMLGQSLVHAPDPHWGPWARQKLRPYRKSLFFAAAVWVALAAGVTTWQTHVWSMKVAAAADWQRRSPTLETMNRRLATLVADRGDFVAAREAAEKELAELGLPAETDWYARSRAAFLAPPQREAFRGTTAALAIAIAESRALEAAMADEPARSEAYDVALKWNEAAGAAWTAPTRPVSLARQRTRLLADAGRASESQPLAPTAGAELRDAADQSLEAWSLVCRRDFAAALRLADAAATKEPRDPTAHFTAGLCHWFKRSLPEAQRAFEACRDLRPADGVVRLRLAAVHNSYRTPDHVNEAIRELVHARDRAPDFDSYEQMGYLYRQLGQYDLAAGQFDRAAQLKSSAVWRDYMRVKDFGDRDKPSEAAALLAKTNAKTATSIDDQLARIVRNRAEGGDVDVAHAAAAAAAAERPWMAMPLMALAYPSNGPNPTTKSQTEEALSKLIRLFPDENRYRLDLALKRATWGRRAEALAEVEAAQPERSTDKKAKLTCAMILAQTSRQNAADGDRAVALLRDLAADSQMRYVIRTAEALAPLRNRADFPAAPQAKPAG